MRFPRVICDLALLSQDEEAISKILRENNRFNDSLAKVEAAGTAEQGLVDEIRSSQDEAMAVDLRLKAHFPEHALAR